MIRESGIRAIDATGLPIGMFDSGQFSSHIVRLEPGESLLLYSDGFIETQSVRHRPPPARATSGVRLAAAGIVGACVSALARFRGTRRMADDLTVMAIRRLEG